MKKPPLKLRPFLFHGCDLVTDQGEAEGTCPFCDKENHFHVSPSTGQWSCKRCGESGNIPTFLQSVLDAGQRASTKKALQALAKDRNLPVEELTAWGIVPHPFEPSAWLIPGYNHRGKLANLYKAVKGKDGWKALSTPACKTHPFQIPESAPANKNQKSEVMVAEGPWDAIALRHALSRVRRSGSKLIATGNAEASLAATVKVLGSPGAGSFRAEWVEEYLSGKRVYLLFDNDHPRKLATGKTSKPGWDGMQRIVKLCSQSDQPPRALHLLHWGPKGIDRKRKNGYDLSDLFADQSSKAGLQFIFDRCKKAKAVSTSGISTGPEVEPIPRESFAELCRDFESNLHFHPNMRDTLAVMLAVVTSTTLYGDQIWFRVIGPPGSGKSTLAECISASKEYTIARSVLTGFHSGYTAGNGGRKKSASLIPRLRGKTLVVKDADTIVSSPSRDRILSELRDIYDGTSRAEYRNRQVEEHTGIQATFILCGTDELRTLNRTFLGERFLDCEILGEQDQSPFLRRAIDNTYDRILGSLKPPEEIETDHEVHGENRTRLLQGATAGFIEHLKTKLESGQVIAPLYPDTMKRRVEALGNILACIRVRVRRDRDELLYRPRKELATRLCSQFTKLAVCLAIVMDKQTVDREVYRILQKIALDTGQGFTLEITQLLASNPQGLSTKQIALSLSIPETTTSRILKDMLEVRTVSKVTRPNRSGIRGRNVHLFTLSQELSAYWRTAFGKRASKKKGK